MDWADLLAARLHDKLAHAAVARAEIDACAEILRTIDNRANAEGRRDALEEAALYCDAHIIGSGVDGSYMKDISGNPLLTEVNSGLQYGAGIRALKEPTDG